MHLNEFIICPGCGLRLLNKQLFPNDRYNASGECFELYGQLSGYTLSQNDSTFIHQLTGDAYGAQHSGGVTKNITTIFALIGLCLVMEHNYTGRQVQKVHMRIAKQSWPRLDPPKHNASITVLDVLEAKDDIQRANLIKSWVTAVWDSLSQHHEWVRQKTKEYI